MLDTPELRSRIQQQETEKFIIRVMVALIILYDHIHPTGAFAKGITVIALSQLGYEIKNPSHFVDEIYYNIADFHLQVVMLM